MIVHHLANTVRPTGRRCAWLFSWFWEIDQNFFDIVLMYLCGLLIQIHMYTKTKTHMYIIHTFRYLWSTQCERISSGTRETAAHRNVIDHVAFRIGSTRANTRIHAKLINTRLYSRAVRIHSAFWTTVRVWITEIVWKARADSLSAICVWSTG